MNTKITKDALESHLSCKYKSFLKLTGQQGTSSEYETVFAELRDKVRLRIIDQILTEHREEEVKQNVPLTQSTLKQGAAFIFDPILTDDSFSLVFDGFKLVDGPSKLGDSHYIPVLFHGSHQVGKALTLTGVVCLKHMVVLEKAVQSEQREPRPEAVGEHVPLVGRELQPEMLLQQFVQEQVLFVGQGGDRSRG